MQPLGDDACLNEDVIGAYLALDVVAVVGRLTMKMLIAIAVAQRGHGHYPEMIGECTDQAGGLFEAMFDLEAEAIDINSVDTALSERSVDISKQEPRVG